MDHTQPSKTQYPLLHLAIIAIILFTFGWTIISSLTFFSNDIGLRFLQMRMLIAQQWQSLAIPYVTKLDPNFEHVPYYYAYSLVNGRLFLNISPFYPFLGSLLYAGFGLPGIVFSPIVGTLLTAWGVYKLAAITHIRRPLIAMWTAVFATPLLFYSLQLWDHSLGTGLSTLGIAWIAQGMITQERRQTAVGGMLLGWALGQRPELYLFVVAAAAAWIFTNLKNFKNMAALIIGGLAGALPVWLLQYLWVGHPFGMATATHLFGYGRPDAYPVESYSEVIITPAIKMGRLLFEIESRDPVTFSAAILALIGLVLLVFAIRVPRYQKTAVLATGTVLTILGYVAWIVVAWEGTITGLVSTFTLLAFAVTLVDKSEHNKPTIQAYRFVLITAVLFVTLMLLLWPSFGGSQWGARYLLPAYPLLVFLAFYAIQYHGEMLKRPLQTTLTTSFILLIVTGSILQFVGVRHLYSGTDEMAAARETINKMPTDLILTNHPFLPSFLTSVETKSFLFVKDTDQLTLLIPQMTQNNIRTFALLPIESGDIIVPNEISNIIITEIEPTIYQLEMTEQ